MIDWWNGLTVTQQILSALAIPATVILLLQTIMLLFGLGGHGDGDAHGGGHDGGHFDSDGGAHGDIGHAGGAHGDFGHVEPGGVHESHAFEHDNNAPDQHDVLGLRLFTVRGMVAFFAVGGWLGIALIDFGMDSILALFLGMLAGFLSMVLMAWFFKWAMSLQTDGTLDYANALGKDATVYIPIPPGMSGIGKINVLFQDSYVEAEAMTKHPETLKTGIHVKVIEVRSNSVLVVEPDKP